MAFDAIVVNMEQRCSLHHGSAVNLDVIPQGLKSDGTNLPSRAYTQDGDFIGMIKYDPETKLWRPEKIFLKSCCQKVIEPDSTAIEI
jgi:hypothetical protein